MKKITIYSSLICPYCIAAKKLLISEGLGFEEIINVYGKAGTLIVSRVDWYHSATPNLNKNNRHLIRVALCKNFFDIDEHSKCQPGLPFPQGEFQKGSSFSDGFHKTKSSGFFLFFETSTLDPAIKSSNFLLDNFP